MSRRREKGFTLIEILTVVAILGILGAITIPSVIGLVGRGRTAALIEDQRRLQNAVDEFFIDLHTGPDSGLWGDGVVGNFFPTEEGEVGDVELNTLVFDPENFQNPRVDVHLAGPGTAGAAGDSDIEDALIWMGLLVNEAFGASPGSENTETGDAHPLAGEEDEYLRAFPKSARFLTTPWCTFQRHTGSFTRAHPMPRRAGSWLTW